MPARLGPKTFPMERCAVLNRVHKLAGFVYGACRLRRDKRDDSYLEIDLLHLRPSRIWLRPIGDAPLPVRAGACPADSVRLRHAPRGLLALRTSEVENLPWADDKHRSKKDFGQFLASWPSASRGRTRPASSTPLGTPCIAPQGWPWTGIAPGPA